MSDTLLASSTSTSPLLGDEEGGDSTPIGSTSAMKSKLQSKKDKCHALGEYTCMTVREYIILYRCIEDCTYISLQF